VTDHSASMIRVVQELIEPTFADFAESPTLNAIAASGDPLYIAPLLDLGYFVRGASFRPTAETLFGALAEMTGEDFGFNWQAYFNWASENDVELPPGYDTFKGFLFSTLIDPEFDRFFDDVQGTSQVNLLEAVWGGVAVDGIPSLVNARQISPEEAAIEGDSLPQFCRQGDCRYPAPDELVFGVSIDGDNRAYPLRLLNWHEMFNDVIGQMPFYNSPDGEVVCQFRAPGEFRALERQGEQWVRISGLSAGCPTSGWLANPASLVWNDGDWQDLPDVEDTGTETLPIEEGIVGHVPGKPVMLAYCTLCGSGILYDPVIDDLVVDGESMGRVALEFGSTGMLMRSNKLMYDRTTDTVWNAITGEPAFGPLAESGLVLERLPVVVTDWQSWLDQHPDTSVLSLNTGYNRNYTNGGAYSDYFNDPEFIMFPVWQQDDTEQENKEVIFALNLDDTPKAYPLRHLIPQGVTNDTLGDIDLVIISRETPQREFFEPGGATVRAYERGEHTFSPTDSSREVVDENGDVWRVTEEALIGPDDAMLPRLPGHLAFWFGWFGFYPETLVYEPIE